MNTASPAILAIDTSGEHGSLAILQGTRLTETALHAPEGGGHSSHLFAAIEALLGRAGLGLAEIDCFAAASGPGSFTGIRIALSAAKGLAASLDKPMVAISNLEALAWFGEAALRAPVIDARRGEIFGAVYDAAIRPVQPEVVAEPGAWLAALPQDADLEIVTTDAALLEGRTPSLPPLFIAPAGKLARAIAYLATHRYLAGLAVDPALVDANYVRRSDAELHWTDTGSVGVA